MNNTHIVCFSGGEGSALVAVEVLRRYGNDNMVLLNHDISAEVEDADIKRFKTEVAEYCRVPITYANMRDWDKKTQFDVVVEAGAFKVGTGTALCTNRMKTAPFDKWLEENDVDETCVIYYGFEKGEQARILRRASIMAAKGYRTDFPLAFWPRTIQSTKEIGINPPLGYAVFKHANCIGCLKAGMQHWYVVYCMRPDIWAKGVWAEEEIGYSIIKGHYLLDLEPKFDRMKELGIEPTEKLAAATFWARAKKILDAPDDSNIPCECAA